MARSQSPREIEHDLQRVKDAAPVSDGEDAPDIAVSWDAADPENRPEGIQWDPDEHRLTYDLWDAQREFIDTLAAGEADITAFLGGYRSGKTVAGARWTLKNALETPGSRWLAMGIDFQKAQGTTFRVLFEQLPGERTHLVTSSYNGPESSPAVVDYNRKEHRLTLANDAIITLGSADKWSRYAGDEYSGVWLDEPSHYGDELYDLLEIMSTRLTADVGPKRMAWSLTGNGFNAAWRVLKKREDKNGDPIGSTVEIVRASVEDNPYIDPSDKDRIRRQFEGSKRAEQALRGGFSAAEGLVYDDFSPSTHVVDHAEALEKVEDSWRVYGYDAGWNDPRVVLEAGKTAHNELVILDEFYESSTHVDRAIEWLKRNGKPSGTIYAEHEPGEIDKFRNAGWRAENAEKSHDAGIAEVRSRFRQAGNKPLGGTSNVRRLTWGKEKRDRGESEPEPEPDPDRVGLLISENCPNLIRELQSYKEEDVGGSNVSDHCVDSLRYLCMGVADTGSSVIRRKASFSKSNIIPEEHRR